MSVATAPTAEEPGPLTPAQTALAVIALIALQALLLHLMGRIPICAPAAP